MCKTGHPKDIFNELKLNAIKPKNMTPPCNFTNIIHPLPRILEKLKGPQLIFNLCVSVNRRYRTTLRIQLKNSFNILN